jgi:hypothetical protein
MKKSVMAISIVCVASIFAADVDIQKQKNAAMDLKKTLMGELKTKISEGPSAAVEFCSKNALDITKAVAKKHGLNIKRVSEKNRNPQNGADESDKKALKEFAEAIKQNKKPQEFIVVDNKYYEPLVTNDMCAVCHGKEGDIAKETKTKIMQNYPNDKATGYSSGELRGAIVVW